MANLFPQHTSTMQIEEPMAFRRLSFSLVEMALITGVLIRVFRSLVLSHVSSGFVFIGLVALGGVLLVGMATAHLANFPLHHWVWRAPAFVGLEVLAEMATSLFLIWLGREPYGAVRAHMADWLGLLKQALLIRGLIVLVWALVLSMIVQVVRTRLVKEEADDPVTAD